MYAPRFSSAEAKKEFLAERKRQRDEAAAAPGSVLEDSGRRRTRVSSVAHADNDDDDVAADADDTVDDKELFDAVVKTCAVCCSAEHDSAGVVTDGISVMRATGPGGGRAAAQQVMKTAVREVVRDDGLHRCECGEFYHAACMQPPQRDVFDPFVCMQCVMAQLDDIAADKVLCFT